MKFSVGKPAVDPNVFDCNNPKPGVYRSAKGSWLIKPEANVTTRGNKGTQSEHALIHDVDTGKVIIKICNEVKGTYTYVADLQNVEVIVKQDADCGCKEAPRATHRGF